LFEKSLGIRVYRLSVALLELIIVGCNAGQSAADEAQEGDSVELHFELMLVRSLDVFFL
jgi:hypothetical protein